MSCRKYGDLRQRKEIWGVGGHKNGKSSLGIFVEWKGKRAEVESLRKTDILMSRRMSPCQGAS